jgi:hypothetical protein
MNLSQGFLDARTTRGERNLKVADGHEAKVEAIETLPLVLTGSFALILNNVLFIPSLQRNLILLLCWKMRVMSVFLGTISALLNVVIKFFALILGKECWICYSLITTM